MISVKSTASFTGFRKETLHIMDTAENVYMAYGIECEITCGTNGHGPLDPHPHAFALDFGTHAIPQNKLKLIHQELIDRLGPNYTVLYSDKNIDEAVYVDTPNAHFHIQLRKDLWRKLAGIPL